MRCTRHPQPHCRGGDSDGHKQRRMSGDSVLVGRGGRQIDVSLMIIANYGSDGRLEGLSFLGQDMTAWTRTEEALRKTQGELLRLSAQH